MVKVVTDERVSSLVNYVLEVTKYGDVIKHKQVSKIIGVEESLTAYYRIVGRARDQLILKGKTIDSVRGTGYTVVLPDGYNELAHREFAKGVRQINRARDIAQYAPKDLMTPEHQIVHTSVAEHTASYADLIRQKAEELRLIVSPIKEGDEEK